MSGNNLRWKTAVVLPEIDQGWSWISKEVFFMPAISRLLVLLKKHGIDRAYFLNISDEDFLEVREVLKCLPEEKLPDVFRIENENVSIDVSRFPVLVISGGFLWHDSILKWFDERLLSQNVGAIYRKGYNIPCLASVDYDLFQAMCSTGKNIPTIGDFAVSFLWPSDVFCAPVNRFLDEPETILELVGKPSDRPHVVLVRHLIYPFLRFCAGNSIHPNYVTWLGFLVHITGCYFIARLDYISGIVGSIFLILSWVLDCADGTLARLTFQESKYGQTLDTRLGHLSNITFFAALLIRSWSSYSLFSIIFIGILVFGGITFAASTHARLSGIVRQSGSDDKYSNILIKINHRDYGFVVLAFAVLDILPAFLWLGIVGVYLFGFFELAVLLKNLNGRVKAL